MNREMRDIWLEALRSGRYRQGTMRMKREVDSNTYFCCLGVLREVCLLNGESNAILAFGELKKTGIKLEEASVLTKMNDVYKLSFPQISDWIEVNL